ncbi:hypothetical protein FRX31_027334 [Thalictrum thalictroides]|uniref:DUF8040 domain-containing protein n=1 Tax=Thalictrum thalictroides TaxID=46969 RepID=A0A7J6VD96_THATH|nr:hypothetical protein FRX31_027334 [Thalictrum thalictroides]
MPTKGERLATIIVIIVIAHMMIAYNWWYRVAYNFRRIHGAPYVNRNAMRTDSFARFYLESDNQCHNQLRMRHPTFHTLCRKLCCLVLRNGKHVKVEEQVALFLCIVCHDQRSRRSGFQFCRSTKTANHYFYQSAQVYVGAISDVDPEDTFEPDRPVVEEDDDEAHPEARSHRGKCFPYYEQMAILVEDDTATADLDNDAEADVNVEQPEKTFAALAVGPSTDVHVAYSYGTGYSPKTTPSPPVVLPKRRRSRLRLEMYLRATEILGKDKEDADLFMGMEPELKIEWLLRRLN